MRFWWKQRGTVPPEIMPDLKSSVSVNDLEDVALNSQVVPITSSSDYGSNLGKYQRGMAVDLLRTVELVKKQFQKGMIIGADIGCDCGLAAAQLAKSAGIEFFGIEPHPSIHPQGLDAKRIIVASAEDMPNVPNNSFHFIISFNSLSYTNVRKSFPEIYRVLRPGGFAALDLEFWTERNVDDLGSLPMSEAINVASLGRFLPIDEYLTKLRLMEKSVRSHIVAPNMPTLVMTKLK